MRRPCDIYAEMIYCPCFTALSRVFSSYIWLSARLKTSSTEVSSPGRNTASPEATTGPPSRRFCSTCSRSPANRPSRCSKSCPRSTTANSSPPMRNTGLWWKIRQTSMQAALM